MSACLFFLYCAFPLYLTPAGLNWFVSYNSCIQSRILFSHLQALIFIPSHGLACLNNPFAYFLELALSLFLAVVGSSEPRYYFLIILVSAETRMGIC